jgi:hypothetical protein
MPQTGLLDGAQWRAFRLFLADLDDGDLDRAYQQLRREVTTRQEYERDLTRLFFSSLQAADLQLAQQTIRAERRARAHDRRVIRRTVVPKRTRPSSVVIRRRTRSDAR